MNDLINFYNSNKDWIDKILIAIASLILSMCSFLYTKISHRNSQARLDALEKSDLKGLYVECPRCGSKINLSDVIIYKEVITDNEKKSFKKEE